jgi:hypothetical protein
MEKFKIEKRYWIPVERDKEKTPRSGIDLEKRLDSYDEYMPEPDDLLLRYYGHEEAIETNAPRCLVLLGEMGVGKTQLMGKLKEESDSLNQPVQRYSCLEFSGGKELREVIASACSLGKVLYLDGFDEVEGKGYREAFKHSLEDDVSKSPSWKLRISCRSADWDPDLEATLKKVFGENEVKVVRLAPFCRADVKKAAHDVGIDAEKFLKQVDERGFVSFARLPLTLNFLLSSWERDQKLGEDKWEIFEKGCEWLCDSDYKGGSDRDNWILTPNQRLKIASYIALILRLGGENQICLNKYHDGSGVFINEMIWCARKGLGEETEEKKCEQAIREVLVNTALFKGDAGTRVPEHQGYIDFLAAHCLVHTETKEDIWRQLLTKEGVVYPHERGVVGWLCYQDKSFLEYILEKDFKTLLLSGVDCLDDDGKKKLVEQILNNNSQLEGIAGEFNYRKHFRLLKYDGIKYQLEMFLNRKTVENERSRIEAIEMAKQNLIQDLSCLLVNIALEVNEPSSIRVESISALETIDQNNECEKLKVLLDDAKVENSIKAEVLCLLWPKGMLDAEKVFSVLDGHDELSYRYFLNYDFLEYLSVDDLVIALEWVGKVGRPYQWARAVNTIIWRSWNLILEQPELQEPFKRIVLHFLDYDIPVFIEEERFGNINYNKPNDHAERRRLILQLLIDGASDDEFKDLPHRLVTTDEWLNREDFDFLLQAAADETNPIISKCWAEMSSQIFAFSYDIFRTHGEVIYKSCKTNPFIQDVYRTLLGPIELNSLEAKRMKEADIRTVEWKNKTARWKEEERGTDLPENWREKYVRENIKAFYAGNHDSWIGILQCLSADENGVIGSWIQDGFANTGGWNEISSALKNDVMSVAKEYLDKATPHIPEERNKIYHDNVGGYQAISILLAVGGLTRDSTRFIGKWVVAVIHQPVSYGAVCEEEDRHKLVLETAIQTNPKETVKEVVRYLKLKGDQQPSAMILERFKNVHPDWLCKELVKFVAELKYDGELAWNIISKLLEWEYEPIVDSVLEVWDDASNEKRIGIASCLLMSAYIREVWDILWKWMEKNPEAGKEIFLQVVNDFSHKQKKFDNLSASQRKELSLFLEKQFPRTESPKGAHFVSPEENVLDFKNQLLNLFESNGEVEELVEIEANLPQYSWIMRVVERAREVYFKGLTKFFTPDEIRDLLEKSLVPGEINNLDDNPIRILHLSDLHFDENTYLKSKFLELKSDIEKEFGGKIDYRRPLILSKS